jgi:hypothetical protein
LVLQALFKVCPRHAFALSATPDRKDGLTKVLHWFFGEGTFVARRENQGQVMVFPVTYECAAFHEAPPTNRMGKISLVEMITTLVCDPGRTKMVVDLLTKTLRKTPSRQILVLSDRREHCKLLQSYFPDNSGLYRGGMKQALLEESSKKTIIFATFSQAHEGLDIPTLDTVILATPKSDIKQSIGRILRETAGKLGAFGPKVEYFGITSGFADAHPLGLLTGKKNAPWIFDIVDSWGFLYAMFSKRKRVYKEGGFLIQGGADEPEPEKNPYKGVCLF